MVHELSLQSSIFSEFISEIRDEVIQKDRMRFRRNLERIGEVMAYELSKKLTFDNVEVVTPLGVSDERRLKEQPVLCAIMRAALPMHNGFLNYFDKADNAFVSAYRRHHKGGDFEIEVDYISAPTLDDRLVIIVDPMLATGSSIEKVYRALLQKGEPKKIIIASAIASTAGVAHVKAKLPENTEIWVGAIDSELTAHSYIVPGLGDAGDLAFGSKD
ncbi:MAG: uracil phosphoribosyltransferase [Flavobacteriales bacterium]